MINTELASRIIQAGQSEGAEFVELFVEETRESSLVYKDRKVENASAGTDFGIGIRLIYGTQVLYAFTSDDEEDKLIRLVREMALAKPGGYSAQTAPLLLNQNHLKFETKHTLHKDPRLLGQTFKLDYLKRADAAARAFSGKVVQVAVSVYDVVSNIAIFNSEGLKAEDMRSRIRMSVNVTASDGQERFSAHDAPGSLGGYEFLENLDVEHCAITAAERSVKMLEAPHIRGGQMPVVMGNGFGGVIFHEACGHPLETESIRRKASPFCGKMGELIAHPKVTAIDDGTITQSWGSLHIDDEGMPVEKTVLIKDGILQQYLSDRVGAQETGVRRTGSGRRESYKYAPVARMRNTYIDAGTDRFEEMIASIDDGLYAKKMGGGSVNPATGEFNFAVEEGYKIEKGKITHALRGATLIGKGAEILPRISMVGNDLEIAAGMCGASSGSVPVTVGQPSLKVDKILVGGR